MTVSRSWDCQCCQRSSNAGSSDSREQLDQAQASLLDETIDADIAAIEQELQNLTPASKAGTDTRKQPKRAALPPELPRVEMHHEPESTSCATPGCGCALKRIGEEVSEKLDYTPGLFTVERHIQWDGRPRLNGIAMCQSGGVYQPA